MTLTLSPELEARLQAEAARRGVSPDQLAQSLIAEHLPKAESGGSLAALFAEWAAEDATDDPEELARRQEEGEEFMRSLARNRKEMEGPAARELWP